MMARLHMCSDYWRLCRCLHIPFKLFNLEYYVPMPACLSPLLSVFRSGFLWPYFMPLCEVRPGVSRSHQAPEDSMLFVTRLHSWSLHWGICSHPSFGCVKFENFIGLEMSGWVLSRCMCVVGDSHGTPQHPLPFPYLPVVECTLVLCLSLPQKGAT